MKAKELPSKAKMGAALKKRRTALKLSQKQVADLLAIHLGRERVSSVYINRIEHGQVNLTLDQVDRLVAALRSILKIKIS
jgi:transcriptional regulator with XRE-family HTH domain